MATYRASNSIDNASPGACHLSQSVLHTLPWKVSSDIRLSYPQISINKSTRNKEAADKMVAGMLAIPAESPTSLARGMLPALPPFRFACGREAPAQRAQPAMHVKRATSDKAARSLYLKLLT